MNDLINQFLDENKDLFEGLRGQEEIDKLSLTQPERDALSHLLKNRKEIKAEINSHHNTGYHLFPPRLIDIYLDNFKTHAIKILETHISQFNLTPEETCSIIDERNINNILGKDFLKP